MFFVLKNVENEVILVVSAIFVEKAMFSFLVVKNLLHIQRGLPKKEVDHRRLGRYFTKLFSIVRILFNNVCSR